MTREKLKKYQHVIYALAFILFLAFVGVMTYRHVLRTDPKTVAIQQFDQKLAEAKRLVAEEAGSQLEGRSFSLFKTGDGRYMWKTYEEEDLFSGRVYGEEHEFFDQAARAALDDAIRFRSRPAGLAEEVGAEVDARARAFGNALGVVVMLAILFFAAVFLVRQDVWDKKTEVAEQDNACESAHDSEDGEPFSDLG